MSLKDSIILYALIIASSGVVIWIGYLIYQGIASFKRYRSLKGKNNISGSTFVDHFDRSPDWEEHFKNPSLQDHLGMGSTDRDRW